MPRVLLVDDDKKLLPLLERGFRYEGFEVAAEDGKSFNSGIIAPGKDFRFTFAQPGRYSYRCGVHPTMAGVVTVQGQ